MHIEVRPRYLIPDTNCFVDDLISIRAIASAHPLYQLMIPITGKDDNVFRSLTHRSSGSLHCPTMLRQERENLPHVAVRGRLLMTLFRHRFICVLLFGAPDPARRDSLPSAP